MSDITLVPYSRTGEPDRKAAIIQVPFSTEGLSDEDVQVLGHLSNAVDGMNPIMNDQTDTRTPELREFADRLSSYVIHERDKKAVSDFAVMLDIQNFPFDETTHKSHVLRMGENDVVEAVAASGDIRLQELYEKFSSLIFTSQQLSKRLNFYPDDITDEQFEELGGSRFLVNSSVMRDGDGIKVVLNEDRYRATLVPVIESLKRAAEITTESTFKRYLQAKICELGEGLPEARREADLAWIKNEHILDLILSTGLEVYLDRWKGIRGQAAGNVMVVDREFDGLLHSFVEQFSAWEAEAPWKLKRENINPSTLPKLKFVNVFNWSGDYIGIQTTAAQSLPNDDDICEQHGSVNLLYHNITRAIYGITGSRFAQDMLPRAIFDKYQHLLFDAAQIHFALHELGHATGKLSPELVGRKANDVFGDEYSPLEEARAELFSLYALPRLVREGVLSEDQMEAVYHRFVLDMVHGLKFEPKEAHHIAENMIFHYFQKRGAIGVMEEDGKRKFFATSEIEPAARELLAVVGNIKTYGLKINATVLRDQNCYTDPMRSEIEERTKEYPLGRGLIFPQLQHDGNGFSNKLIYPARFSDQLRYQRVLLD